MNEDRRDEGVEAAQLRRQRDKEAFEKAPSRRALAWDLLKHTRNPSYVALRYGYSEAMMREALQILEERERENDTKHAGQRRATSDTHEYQDGNLRPAGKTIPENLTREGGTSGSSD